MLSSDYDKRMIEHHQTHKGGISSSGCLFCRDQINASGVYVANYDQIAWKKDGCQQASCPRFMTPTCWEHSHSDSSARECPLREGGV